MLRSLFMPLILLASVQVFPQAGVRSYVRETAVAIATIDPDSTRYADLEPIGNAIGNARIVMLGEQDHGDAPCYLAKTRLIKYLHEKKGFNVLVFEGDFFGLNEGWQRLDSSKPAIDSFLAYNIFSIWSFCHTCTNLLYNYIPATQSTAHPLVMAGMDNQVTAPYSARQLAHLLDSFFQTLQLPITKQQDYSSLLLPTLDSLVHFYKEKKSAAYFVRCQHYLANIREQLREKGVPEQDFWMMVIDNLVALKDELQLAAPDSRYSQNARDQQMARNLQWLASVKYGKEKIIVWAANAHIARFPQNMQDSSWSFLRMGRFFSADTSPGKTGVFYRVYFF